MTAVTATEAKNRLGQVLELAQRQPVFIEKAGRRHSVVLSVEHYEALLQANGAEPPIRNSKQFYERYKEWVDEMNRLVDEHGVFGEDMRPW
ncbi:MAG: type II toxin-antitoxin system prevent-host-death family antitoxin [Proteobacteria bacterium]|nr:type II toxin-antitoxin system prevent-host-death family antitoxin [Pseudomonadota bacterium]